MQKEKTVLLKSVNPEKFPLGPTSPRPGPTFPKVVATDVIVVTRSLPSMDTISIAPQKTIIYIKKNIVTAQVSINVAINTIIMNIGNVYSILL